METTGLHGFYDRVVEVGAVRFDLDGMGERMESLVNPGRPIPEETSGVHGIRDSDVKTAPLFSAVASDVVRFLEGSVFVAHNAPFDVSFLVSECGRAGVKLPTLLSLDSCTLSRAAFPGQQGYSLDSLVNNLGINRERGHRALDDSLASAELLLRSFRQLGVQCEEDLPTFFAEHGDPIPIDRLGYRLNPPLPASLLPLTKAKEEKTPVTIVYRDGMGNVTTREIVPLLIVQARSRLVMEAHCMRRNRTLSFRLDRITDMNP